MLSRRISRTSADLDAPWRHAPRFQKFDATTNPNGTLVTKELEEFANSSRVHIPAAAFMYGYSTAGGQRFPKALATHLNEYFHPFKPLTGDDILATGTATALHEILAFSLGDPGDGILICRPCYGRFELDFGNKAELSIVWADSDAETCFRPEVVKALDEALLQSNAAGTKIKALLIVNPHNPLGRCYPRETLVSLMAFCQKHRIHFISDEVYASTVFESGEPDAHPFTSVLSIDPAGIIDQDLVHVTYGMAKDFGSAGLRVGALITRNAALQKGFTSIIRFHSPSGMSVTVASAMLEDREWCRKFLETAQSRISEAFKLITTELSRIGVKYLRGTNAGLFLWIDLSPYLSPESSGLSKSEREFALAQKLLDKGVFLHPGEEHALEPGWFRLVYTHNPVAVREGVKRIQSVIEDLAW
ncbi:pyridoxal phosphate-dependent transferase, major domain [Trichoderma arundinaceum]|uniref:Pyridoxal phosphate-dependent transferase, major domain n=1 Tax=Trichoderma arundinaceum TaxID=490622 RepID=A0A395P0L6_TRIAR|nr:pyridoxal phosphate-dependent transferase, major domain [Trichoderma arundinaceum]